MILNESCLMVIDHATSCFLKRSKFVSPPAAKAKHDKFPSFSFTLVEMLLFSCVNGNLLISFCVCLIPTSLACSRLRCSLDFVCRVENALLVHSLSSGKTGGADVSCTVPMARPWFSSTHFPNEPEAHFPHNIINCLRGEAARAPSGRGRRPLRIRHIL